MRVITESKEIASFLFSLGADSDGGNFALVGGRQAICIDHAFTDDGKEVWYSLLFQSVDWLQSWADMTQEEMGSLVEIRVYDSHQEALIDYVTRITGGTDAYLKACP